MLNYIKNIDRKRLIRVLLCTFILGFIAHGFCFFNANVSHDCLNALVYTSDEYIHQISIGRFMRPIYSMIKGDVELPLVNGLLSLLFIGLSSYIVIDILEIKNKWFKLLTVGIFVTNYSVTLLNASYLHDSDCYGLSLLLSMIGLAAFIKSKHGMLAGILFYYLSLGFYQAYIQVPIYILLIISIKKLLNSEDIKATLLWLFKGFLAIGIAMILYYVSYKLVLGITGIGVSGEKNSVSSAMGLSLMGILTNIITALKTEIKWVIQPKANHWVLIALVNVAVCALIVTILIRDMIRRKLNLYYAGTILFLLILIPFGTGSILIVSGLKHDLMIFSFFITYIFAIVLTEDDDSIGFFAKLFIVLLSIFVVDSCFYSNKAYLKKELESQASLSIMTRIIDRIEQTDGYVVGETPVAIIGSLEENTINQLREKFDYRGMGLEGSYSMTYHTTYNDYFTFYLSYPINCLSKQEILAELDMNEINKLPDFPAKESCQMIDGIMVVKLSDD